MSPFKAPFAVFGFLTALALGCGTKQADEPRFVGDAGAPPRKVGEHPKPVDPNGLPPDVLKLADLEKTITAKEKELADMKAEAFKLRQSLVYRTPAELLADMPKDAFPKLGPAAGIERAKARKWAKATLVGRTIEAELNVLEGGITVTGNDPYTVVLTFNEEIAHVTGEAIGPSGVIRGTHFGGHVLLGGQECQVYTGWSGYQDFGGGAVRFPGGPGGKLSLKYTDCTESEALKLKAFNKQKIRVRGMILEAIVSEHLTGDDDALPIGLACSIPSIDGFLPEASNKRPKESEPKPKAKEIRR